MIQFAGLLSLIYENSAAAAAIEFTNVRPSVITNVRKFRPYQRPSVPHIEMGGPI